jgi:RNA polymerase sigma-70 factor (ECF subfamily)
MARAVRRVCPPWLSAQSDDIVQVAVLRVMDLARRGEGTLGLRSSYLWRVAYSVTVDEIRRLRRRREVGLEDAAAAADSAPSADPERRQAAARIARGLRDCLERLVEDRRLALTLHLQGHSVPEAAALLGWGLKKVENLVYRGLADLRRCLTSKGLTP